MALISVVQKVMVEQHKLLDNEEMLNGISLATLLPGAIIANLIAYIGYRLRGSMGAFVSVVGVLLPSFLLMVCFTMAYLKWGQLPTVNKLLMGFIPAVTAIIVHVAWKMSLNTIKSVTEIGLVITAACLLSGIGGFYITVFIILGSGVLGCFLFRHNGSEKVETISESQHRISNTELLFSAKYLLSISFLVSLLAVFVIYPPVFGQNSQVHLVITFAGMSLILFGGGFAFIPLIQEIVVDTLHWLTQVEFVTAITVGQITPGPIVISVVFIGYKIQGFLGAITATIAIFFPPALLMVIVSQAFDRIKHLATIQATLKGIRAAVVGMIFTAAVIVGQTASIHWATLVIFMIALVAMFHWRIDVIWIIPSAGILGLLFY